MTKSYTDLTKFEQQFINRLVKCFKNDLMSFEAFIKKLEQLNKGKIDLKKYTNTNF